MLIFVYVQIDRPVTYLYNTLHYYERMLRNRLPLKKRLVSVVLGSLRDSRVPGLTLTDTYQEYMTNDTVAWVPELDYYVRLVQRMAKSKDK